MMEASVALSVVELEAKKNPSRLAQTPESSGEDQAGVASSLLPSLNRLRLFPYHVAPVTFAHGPAAYLAVTARIEARRASRALPQYLPWAGIDSNNTSSTGRDTIAISFPIPSERISRWLSSPLLPYAYVAQVYGRQYSTFILQPSRSRASTAWLQACLQNIEHNFVILHWSTHCIEHISEFSGTREIASRNSP